LICSIERKEQIRQKILRRSSRTDPPLGIGHIVHERSQNEFQSLVTYEVHEQVHARARILIQTEVRAQLRAELQHGVAPDDPGD
jgi:hypothetical protein